VSINKTAYYKSNSNPSITKRLYSYSDFNDTNDNPLTTLTGQREILPVLSQVLATCLGMPLLKTNITKLTSELNIFY